MKEGSEVMKCFDKIVVSKKLIILIVVIIASLALIIARFQGQALPEACEQRVKGNGLCEAYFEGYEFDKSVNKCVKRGVSGCSFETPFSTLEECRGVCKK